VEEKQMKKLISIMAACLLVFGFAGMASGADGPYCVQCEGEDPGTIDRGCETSQQTCTPFDYENPDDYCYTETKGFRRALFELCDCYPDLKLNDTIFVSMEILVDRGTGTPVTGDNGVYWAEDVNTLGPAVEAFKDQAEACNPLVQQTSSFPGYYVYSGTRLVESGSYDDAGYLGPMEEDGCTVPDNQRYTRFEPDYEWLEAYAIATYPSAADPIQEAIDELQWGYRLASAGKATLWIDIPEMRVDPSRIQRDWGVYVRICIDKKIDSICGTADCCCLIYIGSLCCEEDTSGSGAILFPYFTAANSGWWSGLALTNLSDADGYAPLPLYEADGDVFQTATPVLVKANSIEVFNHISLYALDWNVVKSSAAGVAGDDRFYVEATGEFPMAGFGMMAKVSTGESMGYLAYPKWLMLTQGLVR